MPGRHPSAALGAARELARADGSAKKPGRRPQDAALPNVGRLLVDSVRHLHDQRGMAVLQEGLLAPRLAEAPPQRAAARAKPGIDARAAGRHPLASCWSGDTVVSQKLALRLLRQRPNRANLAGNGTEASRRVRASCPDPVHPPPILAMTANAMQRDREQCLAAGNDGHVTKPIRVEAIVDARLRAAPR